MSAVLHGHSKQLVLASAILGASLWLLALTGPAAGLEEIKDPGLSADSFADTIARSKEADPIVDRLIALSRDKFTRADLDNVAAYLDSILGKAVLPGSKDRLAEKRYGNTVSIYWYRVIYRRTEKDQFVSLYFKLTFMRTIDYVQLTGFTFHTDIDEVDLP